MEDSSIDIADIKVLAHQLGRTARGVKAIIRRCDKGFPQVVLNSPVLSSNTPFPTIYWLTCPLWSKEVAALENQGWIKRFQKQIAEDKNFRKAVLEAQLIYRDARKKMIFLSADFPDYAKDTLLKVGIGGVGDFSKIKCLHAHFAHYLATGANPVGERVSELVGQVICKKECGEV